MTMQERIERRRAQVQREIERRTENIEKVASALRDAFSDLGKLDVWQEEACRAATSAVYEYMAQANRDDAVRLVELDNQLQMEGKTE